MPNRAICRYQQTKIRADVPTVHGKFIAHSTPKTTVHTSIRLSTAANVLPGCGKDPVIAESWAPFLISLMVLDMSR